jgi:outer membrane phospholipase A
MALQDIPVRNFCKWEATKLSKKIGTGGLGRCRRRGTEERKAGGGRGIIDRGIISKHCFSPIPLPHIPLPNLLKNVRLWAVKRIFRLSMTFAGGSSKLSLSWLGAIGLLICLASASAQDLTCAFISPSKPLIAGSQGSLWLYCMNSSSAAAKRTFEPQLKGQLSAGSQTLDVVLLLKDTSDSSSGADTVVIAAGTFARREYVMDVPWTVSNRVVLRIKNYNEIALNVEKGSSMAPVVTQQSAPEVPASSTATNGRQFFAVVTNFSKYLTPYEPIYFIVGSYPAAEFQFSLKYQVFDSTNRWLHPVSDLYFAYTQTSFWDLFSTDPSFYDTSYKPSAFFYFPDLIETRTKIPVQLDFQSGYEHESNGRGGTGERSFNTAYAQPTVTIGLPEDLQLSLCPRAWVYILGVSDNNPDIADYHGYADLTGTLIWKKNYQLTTKYTIGDEGDNPSLTFDFSFGLPRCTGFTPRIHAQYFTGYGETLRQYNQISHGFRVGLSLYD